MTSFDARALLLDMDGTLVDSTAVVERLWTEWALDNGLDASAVLAVAHGRQGQYTMADMLPDRPHEENLAENAEMLRRETAETDGIVEIPGAADLLTALHDASVPIALVTSADDALAEARMGAAGLDVPAVTVTADDVEQSKPSPDGFLAAADILDVAPADCLVFEDSAAGVAAARAAGMRVIGVGEQSAQFAPDAVIPDLRAVQVTPTSNGVRVSVP